MTYQHCFRKIYGFLFLLSLIITIITLFITVNVKGGLPISTYYEDTDIWFSRIVIMPVINIIFSPLIGALVIQWVYKSKIASGVIYCRNTLGVSMEMRINEIKSIQFYNIPIIPVAKIKTASNYWSGWVSIDAAKCIKVTQQVVGAPHRHFVPPLDSF